MSATGTHIRAVSGALRWRVDPARSELGLAGSVMGAPWVEGLLRGLGGSLLLDLEEPAGSTFELDGAGAGLYVGDPFLNSRLRLGDVVGDETVHLSGILTDGVLPGEFAATVWHNLGGTASPLRMAAELWRWDVHPSARAGGPEQDALRITVSAHQLEGVERLRLHLEAVLDEDGLG